MTLGIKASSSFQHPRETQCQQRLKLRNETLGGWKGLSRIEDGWTDGHLGACRYGNTIDEWRGGAMWIIFQYRHIPKYFTPLIKFANSSVLMAKSWRDLFFYPIIVTFDSVEHLRDKLAPIFFLTLQHLLPLQLLFFLSLKLIRHTTHTYHVSKKP